MANKNPRISKSGVTTTGRFPLYSNSPEAKDADPSLVRYVRGNSLSGIYLTTDSDLSADDVGFESEILISSDSDSINSEINTLDPDPFRTGAPSVSDISIVSNTVVYDAAGNPSATLVFKVKNSSGETLKGMNAKVELI
jgi:hypothetical protein